MESSAISISSDEAWKQRQAEFPIGLIEACLWLAAVYAIPAAVLELMRLTNSKVPAGLPEFTPQLAVMGGLAILFLIYWKFVRKANLRALGLTGERLLGDLGFAAVAAIALGVIYAAVIGVIYLVCHWLLPEGDGAFRQFVRGTGFRDSSIPYIVGVVVFFPLLEEFWYRGLMYTPLRREFGKWRAIIFLAFIFGAAHFTGSNLPLNQLFGGLVFAWAFEKRRTLVAPVLLHMAGNGSLALTTHLAALWGFK
ncbi:MAG: CPBP family intramembrane metalloprotease [Planctomycetes bacterium]|nr:CPBP family intramembrane metalloprotease [Planctomycetota bacterium]